MSDEKTRGHVHVSAGRTEVTVNPNRLELAELVERRLKEAFDVALLARDIDGKQRFILTKNGTDPTEHNVKAALTELDDIEVSRHCQLLIALSC